MSTEPVVSSKSIKSQPARMKSTYQYIDATPMIEKVNNELYEYRMNKHNKHKPTIDNELNNSKKDNDAVLDREVEQLLRMTELDKLKAYTSTVNTYGSTGLHNRDHKKLVLDSLVAKGAKRPPNDNIPFNISMGMRNKNIERTEAKQQRQRDIGIYTKTGKSNKRQRLEEYKQNNVTSIDNGLKLKFGRTDKSGVLSIRDNELSSVAHEATQRMSGLKQTFGRTNTKRKR